MPDWQGIVREKIDGAQLPAEQKDEIAAELGSHLEDVYDEKRRLGLGESETVEGALGEVVDWTELTRRIHNAKREERIMSDRAKHLWLPGLASFFCAMIWEVALGGGATIGGPLFRWHVTLPMYGLRLMTLLLCGAVGAFLSRRAGGTRTERVAAALFTPGILLTTMLVVISICAVARAMGLGFAGLDMALLVKPVLMVIVIPGTAMLAGAAPFLWEPNAGVLG